MNEKKYITNEELMKGIHKMVNENGHYEKARDIMDYFSPEDYSIVKIKKYDFNFIAIPNFGGSEGIYVDCYIQGYIDDESKEKQEAKRVKCGTYKTLKDDVVSMKIMGELCGALTFYANKYINQEIDRFDD